MTLPSFSMFALHRTDLMIDFQLFSNLIVIVGLALIYQKINDQSLNTPSSNLYKQPLAWINGKSVRFIRFIKTIHMLRKAINIYHTLKMFSHVLAIELIWQISTILIGKFYGITSIHFYSLIY